MYNKMARKIRAIFIKSNYYQIFIIRRMFFFNFRAFFWSFFPVFTILKRRPAFRTFFFSFRFFCRSFDAVVLPITDEMEAETVFEVLSAASAGRITDEKITAKMRVKMVLFMF